MDCDRLHHRADSNPDVADGGRTGGVQALDRGARDVGSWVAMMPGTLVDVYLETIAGVALIGESRSPWQWGLLFIGLLATIIVTVYITRLARQKLDNKTKLREPAP